MVVDSQWEEVEHLQMLRHDHNRRINKTINELEQGEDEE